ncbi:MAG TPA: aspartate kinase [Bacteroidia bacterium]|jgi:aspartate kinase|nr:aspartate kinase [Bacteroidia bacterium]
MKILKFGGTSVGSAERMQDVATLIKKNAEPVIVVLSAMSGTTNSLVELSNSLYAKNNTKANDLITTLENKYKQEIKNLYKTETALKKAEQLIKYHFDYLRAFTLDMFTANEEKAVLAQGELLSTAMFQFYMEEKNEKSFLLPALNFMRIDENEEPDSDYIETHLKLELQRNPGYKFYITQGYICRNAFGEIDNLKRGGSDYTASLIGAAIHAEEIQIWTDIDGMHNNDPRMVDKTKPISELSFDEAAELAYFGAKILHPTCILPAQKRNVPVKLLNTMEPDAKGTVIAQTSSGSGIKAVAAKDGITAISIKSTRMLLAYGFLRSVFEVFERLKTPIDMITTSEVAVSLTIDSDKYLPEIIEELEKFGQVTVEKGQSIICIVGSVSFDESGYAQRVFSALSHIPIRMISYGGSENNISILVKDEHKKPALQALNKGIFNY